MSAFMVSDDHITAICTFACDPHNLCSVWLNGHREWAAGRHLDMFRMLKQANYDSLTARYGDPAQEADARLGRLVLSPIEIVKAVDCLAYQCCEVSDWDDTDAARTLESVRSAAATKLPGYDEAPWGIEPGRADYRWDRYPVA